MTGEQSQTDLTFTDQPPTLSDGDSQPNLDANSLDKMKATIQDDIEQEYLLEQSKIFTRARPQTSAGLRGPSRASRN